MALFRPTYTDKITGERKTAGVWWFEFVYAGKRYRESAKTTRKTLAGEQEKKRRLELERYHSQGTRSESPGQMLRTVKEAIETYIALYDAPNHSPKSIAWVKERAAHLVRLLGAIALLDVTETRVTSYMRTRSKEGAGHRTINMELQCLSRACGKKWSELWPKVPILDEPTDVGRAISVDEEGRLLGAAVKNKSPFIYAFVRIALLTGMRSGEIRTMQLSRIDLAKRQLRVGHAKTEAGRGRGIPMNNDLFETMSQQVDWLKSTFGKPDAKWFLFPFCDRVKPIDPTRPVTTVKTAWESVRTAAGVDCRLHDLRHTAATKMSENAVPEATMKALLGHMSRTMLERYSHIRNEAKQTAVAGLTLAKPISVVPQVSPKVNVKRARRAG